MSRTNVAASLIFIACLVVEIIQSWFFSSAEPLWPCIKVKVIKTTMSKSTFMPSLNAIAEIFSDIIKVQLQVKVFVNFEMQLWLWVKVKVIGLRTYYIDL